MIMVRKQRAPLMRLTMGILFVTVVAGCSNLAEKRGEASVEQPVVNTEQEGEKVRVTCTIPPRTSDGILFRVKTFVIRDADKNSLPIEHTYGTPTVSFVASDDQMEDITISVLYMDARSFEESENDPDLQLDWSVRSKHFKLADLMTRAENREE